MEEVMPKMRFTNGQGYDENLNSCVISFTSKKISRIFFLFLSFLRKALLHWIGVKMFHSKRLLLDCENINRKITSVLLSVITGSDCTCTS